MGLLLSTLAVNAQIEATPIESLSTYTGTDPYVFDQTARKYYAYNNLGQYEEYGLYPEVSTLKVAGGGATEIEYIRTNTSMGTIPYINLNYIPKSNTRIVTTVNMNPDGVTGTWKAVFGVGNWSNGWVNRLCFFSKGNEFMTLSLSGETAATSNVWNQKVIIDVNNSAGNAKVYDAADGTTELSSIDATPHTTFAYPLYVFAQNKAGSIDCQNPSLIMYDMKIYEGETLVMDLVPVVDGEGNGGLKNKVTGTVYTSANSTNFELSADGQAIAADAGISVYDGKRVINTTDQHEYKWNGTAWEDLGSVYSPIAATNYQDMRTIANGGGWECKYGYESTFGSIQNTNGNDNFFNPYVGSGGWEPYQCKVEGLTKGKTYRVSFNFTSQGWNSWSSYTSLPVFAANTESYDRSTAPSAVGGSVLGMVLLPQSVVTDQPYSFTFTADQAWACLYIQFGVGDDGKNFYFHFDDLLIEEAAYPDEYEEIDWADPNKYTPLEYIESTGAARANAYTLPYNPKTATQIGIGFYAYESSGWQAIFCARNTYAGTGISLYKNGNNTNFGYFTGGTTGAGDNFAPFSFNTYYDVVADVTNLNINGTDYATGNTTTNSTSRNLSLFANPEWDNPFRGRIYYCTISEDGDQVYDFNPVMRHDGAFGFYDSATKTFVLPAQGVLDGYGFKTLDNTSYVYYTADTRLCITGLTAQYLPTVLNLDGATFTWESSDPSIATVAADGTVTGVAAGTVTITATTDADQGWTASYELTVADPNYTRYDKNNVGYAVLTGGEGWGDSPLSAVLDNNATTKFGTSNTDNAWFIMMSSTPVAVSQYSFVTGSDSYDYPGRSPRSWKLEGSNDNQNWTIIDEQVQNYKVMTASKEETVFTLSSPSADYKFFKFSATAVDGFQLGEFWINEQAHTWGDAIVTAATCTVEGKSVKECSDCHALQTEVIPVVAHNYANGACTVCNQSQANVILLRNGATNPYAIKFRHQMGVSDDTYEDIETDWNTAAFDDSAWDELLMPVGTFGPHKTRWTANYNTFWFRRTFEVSDPSAFSSLTLKAVHDDDYAVFVNGTLVADEPDWTANENDWRVIDVDPALLVEGTNVVAVYIEQNYGGAYCDFSLEGTLQVALDETKSDNATKIATFNGATMPVVLTRPLVKDTYNTIILPFDMSAAEIATAFGDGTKLAKLTSYDSEKANYSFESATEIEAGVAYLIKPTADAPAAYSFTDRAISSTVAAATYFVGSFDPQDVAVGDKLVGTGNKLLTVGTTGQIKGFRAFFPAQGNAAKECTFTIDGESTGIIGIDGEIIETTGNIYDLQGRKVNKPSHGVYIVNGKKIVIK